jgi:acyl carrier protein
LAGLASLLTRESPVADDTASSEGLRSASGVVHGGSSRAMTASSSKREIRRFVTHLLHEIGKIPPERIHDQATVDDELQMESVVFIEMQVALEETYDIELDPVRMVELNRLDAIVNYIHACVTNRRNAVER